MKNFRKFTCLLMAILLFVTAFAGCKGEEQVVWESFYEDVPAYDENVSTDNDEDTNSKDETTVSSKDETTVSSKNETTVSSKDKTTVSSKDENNNSVTETTKGRFDGLNYEGITIKVLVWYTPKAWEQKIYDDFEKLTGAKIKLIQQGKNANKLASLVANGDSPDVAMMNQDNFPSYITKKLVQPLDEYIDKSKDTWLAYDIMDKVKYGNSYYAITDHFWGDSYFVYYNTKLFDENLDIKKNPGDLYASGDWNWNTFYELASKMTKKDNQGNITQYGSITSFDNTFALSAGALVITPTNGIFKNTLNSAEMKYASEMEKKLRKDKYMVSNAGDFNSGNVAMYIYPQYALQAPENYFKNVEWDVVPFPTNPNGESYNPSGYQFGTIPKGAKNAEAGYMLINYRAYCQENMTTFSNPSQKHKEMFKKVCTGDTCASLDVGLLGSQVYGLYQDLFDHTQSTQTTIDSWSSKIDGAIKEYEQEMAAYK